MFDSLKSWMNVPIQVRPFLKRSGTGAAEYDEEREEYCYPLSEAVLITNRAGVEVKSGTQLYVDGNVQIDEQDSITFEGHERTVAAVTTFYRNGVPDVKVVYL